MESIWTLLWEKGEPWEGWKQESDMINVSWRVAVVGGGEGGGMCGTSSKVNAIVP